MDPQKGKEIGVSSALGPCGCVGNGDGCPHGMQDLGDPGADPGLAKAQHSFIPILKLSLSLKTSVLPHWESCGAAPWPR